MSDEIWFHRKSNGFYKILAADAKYENAGPNSRAVVYQSISGGYVWIRPYSEFMDGRFIRLSEFGGEYNRLVEQNTDLIEFQRLAFEAHPNIDLDIERIQS